jgi:clan AA aspartic protease
VIQGKVADGRATIPVTFLLPEQPKFSILFVLDTGFNEHLTLPQQAISAMNLPSYSTMQARLADGSLVLLPIHLATLGWDSEEKIAPVLATGTKPLRGTSLLKGFHLSIHFIEGGLVSIAKS